MASVDSGVETGNESNDDPLDLKHEPRPEQTALLPIKDRFEIYWRPYPCDAAKSISFPTIQPSSSLPQNLLFYDSPSDDMKSDNQGSLVRYSQCGQKMKAPSFRRLSRSTFFEIQCLKNNRKPYAPTYERKLRLACSTNNIELVQHILFMGVNPNCCDSQRRSPLHLAASCGYADIVRLLLENGANPNQRDCLGNTPLHLAACNNNLVVVTLLLKAGTDVSSSDYSGRSPLQLAQAKLKLLHRDFSSNSVNVHIKNQVYQVIEMMLEFLHKRGQETEAELLSAFSSRLTLSETKEQVETQVRDLLESLSGLSLENTSSGNRAITDSSDGPSSSSTASIASPSSSVPCDVSTSDKPQWLQALWTRCHSPEQL